MNDSMYYGLMAYLERCPQLAGQRFNFDFLGQNPVQWSLQIPTNDPELIRTTTGDTKNKLDFLIVSINHFGDDSLLNIGNLDGYQAIKRWFERNNRKDDFPNFGSGKTVTGVYAQTDGYIEGTTESTARYQIQCRVEYIQHNENEKQLPRFIRED